MIGRGPNLLPGETGDTALGGAVGVIQPRRGYRFGIDPVLLARFSAERPVSLALDLGCGSGVVGLCLLALGGARRVEGLDLQPEMVERARRGAKWNGWDPDRIRFRVGDLRSPTVLDGWGTYPLVVANPPYRRVGEGRVSPEFSKAVSRTTMKGELSDWAACAARAMAPSGTLCVILPLTRYREFKVHCDEAGLCELVVRGVRTFADAQDRFVLARFCRGSVPHPEVRPSLVLHASGCRYSEEASLLLGSP